MSASLISEVKLIGGGLADGESYRGDCIKCFRAKTFTVTRNGASLVYNCYSTHCSFSGCVGERSNGSPRKLLYGNLGKHKLHPFTGELRELDDSQKSLLLDRVGFTEAHFNCSGCLYAPQEDRIAFPIFAPTGKRRGWVLRSYDRDIDQRWKALTRPEVDEPHLSWYKTGATNCVLIVEDIPSAVRAAVSGTSAVAMCGGGIGRDAISEIQAYAKKVTWAFDPDATAEAIRHHRRYSLYFEESKVLILEKDLKNMTEPELTEVLHNVTGNS